MNKTASSPKKSPLPRQTTVAIVYDFDGTLTPKPMQEYTVLPKLGIAPATFWKKVGREVKLNGGDEMLCYMRLLVEEIQAKKQRLTREDLQSLARNVTFFPGVPGWFPRITNYVAKKYKLQLEHFVISAGMREIIEGVSIRKYFQQVFASEYHFDHDQRAVFPKQAINSAGKTQFLFQINKGSRKVNDYMPEESRPIPFENIIYIGDGETDVPCMTVTKKNGGAAIAVYNPHKPKTLKTSQTLKAAGRIDFFSPADFRPKSELEKQVLTTLDLICSRILFRQLSRTP